MMADAASKSSNGPTSFKVEVYFLTRDYRVLLGIIAVILTVGILLAMKVSGTRLEMERLKWDDDSISQIVRPLEQLATVLNVESGAGGEDARANEVAILMLATQREVAGKPKEEQTEQWEKVLKVINASTISAARKQLYQELAYSMASESVLPTATLTTLAYRQQLPAANFMMALMSLRNGDEEQARQFLGREATFPQSSAARAAEIELAVTARSITELERLAADPVYHREWTSWPAAVLALEKHDWLTVTFEIFKAQWEVIQNGDLILVLISGGIWYLIWLQAIQLNEAFGPRLILCTLALLLGALSTTPTLIGVVYSERFLGLVEGNGFWGDVTYYMLGVGPREEFCKLLAVLPLMPVLLRRGNRLEMLMVSGFAGLGFAVEENIGYFAEHAAVAYGRFLTANFFHVAATALICLSLMEAIKEPRKWWWFPTCFIIVSGLHGIYDVFLGIEVLQVVGGLSSCAFLVIALMFFKKLRAFRSLETNYFWMPASIIFGLTIVMAATLVDASARTGFVTALFTLLAHAIYLWMIIYLFVWQTRSLRYDADI